MGLRWINDHEVEGYARKLCEQMNYLQVSGAS